MEPLRELNEGEKENTAKITEDAARVAELFEKFDKRIHLFREKAADSENDEDVEKKEKREDQGEEY